VFYLEIHQNSIFYILKFVFNINILKRSKNTKNKFNLKQKIFNFFKKIFNFFQKYFCKTNGYLMQRLLLPLLLDTICNSTKTLIIKAYFSFYWTHKNATPYTFIWDISKTNWSADQVQLECFCFWRLDKQQMNMAQTKLEFGLGNDTFRSIQVFKSFLIYTITFFHSICLDCVIKKKKTLDYGNFEAHISVFQQKKRFNHFVFISYCIVNF
jgi:hypothetical protein